MEVKMLILLNSEDNLRRKRCIFLSICLHGRSHVDDYNWETRSPFS